MGNSYLILIVGFLACLFVRTGYELLKEAGKVNPESKPVFVFIFTIMCGLWACWFSLCPLDPSKVNLPEPVRWTGLGIFIAGVVLAVGGLIQLRGLENIKHLVTSGLYAKIRHPMYTGFVLWVVGWSTFHSAMVSLLIGLVGIANIFYWRRLEDARLLAQYGDTYRQYRRTTWF